MFFTLMRDLVEQPGRAFARLVVIVLIATVAVVLVHLIVSVVARSRSSDRRRLARWNLWEKLLYAVTIVSIAALGATAFYSGIAKGVLEGWLLLAHMVGAGVFVVVLPLVAFTWAGPSRFFRGRGDVPPSPSLERFLWLAKLTFWLILASGVMTAGSMLLGMVPLLGTDGQHQLLDVHRYSGLALVVAAMVHCYTVCLGRLGLG